MAETTTTPEGTAAGTATATGTGTRTGTGTGAVEALSLVPKAEAVQSMKDFKSDQEVRWCP
ncbi:hypothetical protein ACFWI6_40660, partial [Streptomyces sp. NPDC127072]